MVSCVHVKFLMAYNCTAGVQWEFGTVSISNLVLLVVVPAGWNADRPIMVPIMVIPQVVHDNPSWYYPFNN